MSFTSVLVKQMTRHVRYIAFGDMCFPHRKFYLRFCCQQWIVKWNMHCVDLCVCSGVQLCLTLCNALGCSMQSSSVHGIFQVRILVWVVISYLSCVSWVGSKILYHLGSLKCALIIIEIRTTNKKRFQNKFIICLTLKLL